MLVPACVSFLVANAILTAFPCFRDSDRDSFIDPIVVHSLRRAHAKTVSSSTTPVARAELGYSLFTEPIAQRLFCMLNIAFWCLFT
jgi:hypothetical protein